jgi:hypothetical protein
MPPSTWSRAASRRDNHAEVRWGRRPWPSGSTRYARLLRRQPEVLGLVREGLPFGLSSTPPGMFPTSASRTCGASGQPPLARESPQKAAAFAFYPAAAAAASASVLPASASPARCQASRGRALGVSLLSLVAHMRARYVNRHASVARCCCACVLKNCRRHNGYGT